MHQGGDRVARGAELRIYGFTEIRRDGSLRGSWFTVHGVAEIWKYGDTNLRIDGITEIRNDGKTEVGWHWTMTQDERWNIRYQEVMAFIEINKRNPSKHYPEERLKYHWIKHTKRLMNQGLLKPDRVALFNKLLDLTEIYKHKNQYA